MKFTTILSTLAVLYSLPTHSAMPSAPTTPALTYLYTAYVNCTSNHGFGEGPVGIRSTIPIIGGNFTGPRLSGKILDVGADWGDTDPQTGIFTADTRYNLQTDEGDNIYIRTFGPSQVSGGLHLHLLFETGAKKYYWLNNIVAIGILSPAVLYPNGFLLRIDAWHMATDRNSTSFINGTMY